MKVTFSWEDTAGAISPVCASEAVNPDGINLLSCLLTDDGGIPYIQSLSWIQEGVSKIDSVSNGEILSSIWHRESWGALIAIDKVKIYLLYDESYFEYISLKQFRSALVSWHNFLKSEPNTGKFKEIEL